VEKKKEGTWERLFPILSCDLHREPFSISESRNKSESRSRSAGLPGIFKTWPNGFPLTIRFVSPELALNQIP